MDCQEFRQSMHAFLDGEFDEPERVVLIAHTQACVRCAQIVETERAFRQRLKTALRRAQPKAPKKLLASIDVTLGREDRLHREESWSSRWLWRVVPTAAAMALLVGVVMSRQEQFSYLVEESIQRHRQQLPMDVTGSSQERVMSFFSDKVPFAVKPPKFRDMNNVVLEGARLSNLKDHKAAYLRYRVGGKRLSVFVIDPEAVPKGARLIRMGGDEEEIVWQRSHGYNVGMFISNGTGYTVASDMEPKQLIQLISHSR